MDDYKTNTQKPERRKSRLYTTEIINSLYEDIGMGFVVDTDPFFPYDNELRNANVTFEMTKEEEEEWFKCMGDAEYFIETYCKFMTDNGRKTVKLRDYQKKIVKTVTSEHYDEEIDEFAPDNREVILLASRQVGKTTTTAAYITWYVCFHTDRNVGIMANKQDTAIEIVDKTQQMIKGLPYFLKPGVVKWGQKGAKFDNGCAIISSATTKSASIGFTMNGILYLDEFAHIEPNICYDFWRSVYPTLSSSKTAQLIVSSTPNGTQNNKFYDLWSMDNGMAKIRVDYWEVPGHDDAWAEEQKLKFGEEEFNQEFLLQFTSSSRALVKGSSLDFMQLLSKRLGKYVSKTLPYEKYLDDEDIVWTPSFDPNGISREDRFVFLIDLAEGKGGEEENKKRHGDKDPDSNTIQIYKLVMNSPQNIERYKSDGGMTIKDAYRYIQVGRWASNSKDEVYCGHLAAALALDLFKSDILDNVRIMLEMNFNGKSCLGAILDNPRFYENLVLKTYHSKPIPGEKAKKYYGFKTGAEKETFCKRGAKMIQKRRIIITDSMTQEQLKSFGYDAGTIKGIACHDDLSYPAVNHIPRMLEEAEFSDWLEEAFENEENTNTKYQVNQLIEQYEMDDPDMSDEQFRNMYAGNDSGVYNGFMQQAGYIGYPVGSANMGNSIGASMRRY